jgi:hypothetical protein
VGVGVRFAAEDLEAFLDHLATALEIARFAKSDSGELVDGGCVRAVSVQLVEHPVLHSDRLVMATQVGERHPVLAHRPDPGNPRFGSLQDSRRLLEDVHRR